jgi:hypothetical protein
MEQSETISIPVVEFKNQNSEQIFIECEQNKTLLLCNLQTIFPNATGLLYRDSNASLRNVSFLREDKAFKPPKGGWELNSLYFVVFSNESTNTTVKVSESEQVTQGSASQSI